MTAFPPNLAASGLKLLRERALQRFDIFQRLMHQEVSGEPYVPARHLEAISWAVEQVLFGDTRRLLIAAPPRHFKTYQVTVAAPPYMLGLEPSLRIVCASYGSDLAEAFAADSRRIMRSANYKAMFPKTRFSSSTPPLDHLRTTAGGYRRATSIGGPLTGIGADVLIVDDPLKASDASSKNARDAAYDWLKGTAMTRFDKPSEGAVIVVMQRLHQDDLVGRLMGEGGWELLELPAEAITTISIPTGPKSALVMKAGDILFPERFDEQVLKERRRELGEAAYSAQYLQRPTPPGGHLFKLKHFGRFDLEANRKATQYEKIILSMDTGVSTGPTSDYTAYTVWGVRGEELYLLVANRGRWAFGEQLQRLRSWRARADILVVERSHIGIGLLEELVRETGNPDRLHGYTPKLEKFVRAEYAAAFASKGRVFLPASARWLEMFEQELAGFPHVVNDDLVDSFSQLVHVLVGQGAPHWFGLKAFKQKLPEVKFHLLS